MSILEVPILLDVTSSFEEHDPSGVGLTIIAMLVVLFALFVLSLVFKALGPILAKLTKAKGGSASNAVGEKSVVRAGESPDEAVAAAIALALHEHFEALRNDDIISLSIQEISKRYSPWGDKRDGVQVNQLQRTLGPRKS